MPSDREIDEFSEKHSVRVWGVSPGHTHQPALLGEIVVIPFDDVIAAVNAAENLAYERGVKAGRALWIDDVGGRGR